MVSTTNFHEYDQINKIIFGWTSSYVVPEICAFFCHISGDFLSLFLFRIALSDLRKRVATLSEDWKLCTENYIDSCFGVNAPDTFIIPPISRCHRNICTCFNYKIHRNCSIRFIWQLQSKRMRKSENSRAKNVKKLKKKKLKMGN